MEWIACEDRCPGELERVLVFIPPNRVEITISWDDVWRDPNEVMDYLPGVTHWMPLPPPPKA